MTCFGLKWGQDLENRAAHPHQEFPGVPPSRGFNVSQPANTAVAPRSLPLSDPDLGIRGTPGHPDPLIRRGKEVYKKFFRPFGAQFGLKIRGSPGPPENLEAPGIF